MNANSQASTSDVTTFTTTTTSNNIMTKQRSTIVHGGIADYFAILGIGDTLTFKSSHKVASSAGSDSIKDGDFGAGENDSVQKKLFEEEECAMLERFYREIVDIALIDVIEDSSTHLSSSENTFEFPSSSSWDRNSNIQGIEAVEQENNSLTDILEGGTHEDGHHNFYKSIREDYFIDHRSKENPGISGTKAMDDTLALRTNASSISQQSSQSSSTEILRSPRHRSTMSEGQSSSPISTNSYHGSKLSPKGIRNRPQSNHPLTAKNHRIVIQGGGITMVTSEFPPPHDIAGYKVLWRTIPSGRSSADAVSDLHGDESYTSGTSSPSKPLGQSFDMILQRDIDVSMTSNSSADFDETCNGTKRVYDSLIYEKLWGKGQTFNADLHCSTGLRASILSNPLGNSEVMNYKSQDGAALATGYKLKYGLSGLVGKRMVPGIVNLKNQISPLLGNKTSYRDDDERTPAGNRRHNKRKRYYVGFRRRGAEENDWPSIADVMLTYVRIHRSTIIPTMSMEIDDALDARPDGKSAVSVKGDSLSHTEASEQNGMLRGALGGSVQTAQRGAAALTRGFMASAGIAARVVSSGSTRILGISNSPTILKNTDQNIMGKESSTDSSRLHESLASSSKVILEDDHHVIQPRDLSIGFDQYDTYQTVPLKEILSLPDGFDEWVIPDMFQTIRIPSDVKEKNNVSGKHSSGNLGSFSDHISSISPKSLSPGKDDRRARRRMRKTYLYQNDTKENDGLDVGVETVVDSSTFLQPSPSVNSVQSPNTLQRNPWSPVEFQQLPLSSKTGLVPNSPEKNTTTFDRDVLMPVIVTRDDLPQFDDASFNDSMFDIVPILAVRRQLVGHEQRFHEDPGIVDIAVTFFDKDGKPVLPEEDDAADDNDDSLNSIYRISNWSLSLFDNIRSPAGVGRFSKSRHCLALAAIVIRRNTPIGFSDVPFATRVLDRFPRKDYKGLPLPTEELPMFCYPRGGCHLLRAKRVDCPQAQFYGFVVKNERGDSIFVSCVSFLEPLSKRKLEQLDEISQRWRKTSLPHKRFCEQKIKTISSLRFNTKKEVVGMDENTDPNIMCDGTIFTGFDQIITFECKTICLTSRFPFWNAYKRFLAHLQGLSASSSDLPLERYISHFLLTVPIPKPGGQCIIMPLPAMAGPVSFAMPPAKDLPLLDIPLSRLFSCLDVPTVVAIVFALLALERKVILMSSYPSLVSDACELLRALLFPFELCAPYVPRLTQPFMSCLEFPGSIFVGIHDDGSNDGLATIVRKNIPEETVIVDLDTGDMDYRGNRDDMLLSCWDVLPSEPRSLLVSEIEILCRDANIVPGQEALDDEIDASIGMTPPIFLQDEQKETLDDRAVRDCFLRFFCSILGGYERYLVVPDIDFLISGSEWFDSEGYLAIAAPSMKPYLTAFVGTQMFQAFIQRRTEASDVRCLLFDECISMFHSFKGAYGRLSREINESKTKGIPKAPTYNLLVDQCAAEVSELTIQESEDGSSAEMSFLTSFVDDFMMNSTGDLVTAPSRKHLPLGSRFFYCIDGNPCFPQKFDTNLFYPKEPERLSADLTQINVPILTRSDREVDESRRRRKQAISYRGISKKRRCLLQLPKLMGCHCLCSWLMCIPNQVSQSNISSDQQARYLLYALGAVRLLRSRQRIVPDEAGYRCLIIACGRTSSDRRIEVVKLFGLLRSDGLFPSAVTLGQYTKAIAEGFSKRSSGKSNYGAPEALSLLYDLSHSSDDDLSCLSDNSAKNIINILDGNLSELLKSGRSWRRDKDGLGDVQETNLDQPPEKENLKEAIPMSGDNKHSKSQYTKRGHHKAWFPVTCSSSFSPHWDTVSRGKVLEAVSDFKFVALWSRATTCDKCKYVPLDEEIQGGWESQGEDDDQINSVACPRCFSHIVPLLGYKEMTIDAQSCQLQGCMSPDEDGPIPPQVKNSISHNDNDDDISGYVPYLSPSKMRHKLEKLVEEYGEDVLERHRLSRLDPAIFYNLWWYCARFSIPLPLAIEPTADAVEGQDDYGTNISNWCAIASWDKSVAEEGCRSAAAGVVQFLKSLIRLSSISENFPKVRYLQNIQLGEDISPLGFSVSDDFPLLSSFNLQSFAQKDWDHPDLSLILFKLVEACDKRDLLPVIECLLQRNRDRVERFGGAHENVELNCYRTLIYLTKYQCTSAFHRFYPSVLKPCKGWHFWCPTGTISIFDRLYRDASDRLRLNGGVIRSHEISDIALGYRSIFGHII